MFHVVVWLLKTVKDERWKCSCILQYMHESKLLIGPWTLLYKKATACKHLSFTGQNKSDMTNEFSPVSTSPLAVTADMSDHVSSHGADLWNLNFPGSDWLFSELGIRSYFLHGSIWYIFAGFPTVFLSRPKKFLLYPNDTSVYRCSLHFISQKH